MNAIEIIDDTVSYYKTHGRGLVNKPIDIGCTYLSATGEMCAVGRCFDSDKIRPIFEKHTYWKELPVEELDEVLDSLEDYLRPPYQGMSIMFWQRLQTLHDLSAYWEKSEHGWELTKKGEAYVAILKNIYKNDNDV